MREDIFLKNLKEIYRMFEDDLSKELYLNRLNWIVTGSYQFVERIVQNSHPNFPIWNCQEEKNFLNELPMDEIIYFYGAGSFAERLLPYLDKHAENIIFCDRDIQKQKTGFYNFGVVSPEEMLRTDRSKKVVICTTKYYQDTENYLLSHGITKGDIIDIRRFFVCGTGDEYFYEDFLQYNDEEVFIDAGCCDLRTTIEFSKLCSGLKKVYAFEPDYANYENCVERLKIEKEHLPEIVMLPYGTWSDKAELGFESRANGCSHVGVGNTIVQVVAIDDIVEVKDKVTFIKMDVEGSELESLKGAQNIIKRDRPKLAICIYHKPEDIMTLPLYIKSLVSDYKFYLRSYSNSDNEMVLYAV